jgi:hypothetical protein
LIVFTIGGKEYKRIIEEVAPMTAKNLLRIL